MPKAPRNPLDQVRFDALPMRTTTIAARTWCNLRFNRYAKKDSLYYCSPDARLTPVSMTVPCLYLARSEKTAFYELYGDRLYAEKLAASLLSISDSELQERVFVRVSTRELRLCDLVAQDAARALGMDAGTLYAADVTFPQTFAERIFHHPLEVDGIHYPSRHTGESCAVAWLRNLSPCASLVLTATIPLSGCVFVRALHVIELFGERMTLVAGL